MCDFFSVSVIWGELIFVLIILLLITVVKYDREVKAHLRTLSMLNGERDRVRLIKLSMNTTCGECDTMRVERDAARVERDAAQIERDAAQIARFGVETSINEEHAETARRLENSLAFQTERAETLQRGNIELRAAIENREAENERLRKRSADDNNMLANEIVQRQEYQHALNAIASVVKLAGVSS